jgi:hypothetical protein
LVWFANVGMVSDDIVDKFHWKDIKESLSLVKKWMGMMKAIINFSQERAKLLDIERELSKYDKQVVGTTCMEAT